MNTQLEAIGNFSVDEGKIADLDEDKIAGLDAVQTSLTEYIVQQRELKRHRQRRPASILREIIWIQPSHHRVPLLSCYPVISYSSDLLTSESSRS